MLKKGAEAAKAVENSKKEMEELNRKKEAEMEELKRMSTTCKTVKEQQSRMETTVEEEKMKRMRGSFEMTSQKGKPGNMAELSEVQKTLGEEAEVRGREDPAGVNINPSETLTGRSRYFSYPNVAEHANSRISLTSRPKISYPADPPMQCCAIKTPWGWHLGRARRGLWPLQVAKCDWHSGFWTGGSAVRSFACFKKLTA
jgi:hypothetical protein